MLIAMAHPSRVLNLDMKAKLCTPKSYYNKYILPIERQCQERLKSTTINNAGHHMVKLEGSRKSHTFLDTRTLHHSNTAFIDQHYPIVTVFPVVCICNVDD